MSSVDSKIFENKKIILNNTNFLYLENLLKTELVGGFVQKVQSLNTEDFYIRFKIRKDKENKELVIGNGLCLISNVKTEAKEKNKGFSLSLNSKLVKRQIKNIKQINFEKIIVFEFLEYNLYCEFFSKNNIIFTDKQNKILYTLIREAWKDRKIARNQIYKPPKMIAKTILEYEPKETDLDMTKNLVSNIVKNVDVNPIIIEEYIKIKKLNKTDFNFKDYQKTINFLKEIYNKHFFEKTKYYTKENKIYLFNIDIPFLQTLNFNLNSILENIIFKESIYSKQNEILNKYNKQKNRLKRIIDSQKKAKNKIIKKGEDAKTKAEVIYQNYEFFETARKNIEIMFKLKKPNDEIKKYIEKLESKYKNNIKFKEIDKKRQEIVFLKP